MKRLALLIFAVAAVLTVAACVVQPNHNDPAGTGQGYPDDKPAADDAGP